MVAINRQILLKTVTCRAICDVFLCALIDLILFVDMLYSGHIPLHFTAPPFADSFHRACMCVGAAWITDQ